MAPPEIPSLQVRGTHREVGRQIGEALRERIRGELEREVYAGPFPEGRALEDQLALAAEYLRVTAEELPWLAEEFEGCAEAAGVDLRALFAWHVEEIWYEPRRPVRTAAATGRCSDLVAVPPATAGGHVLVAHNNDLRPEAEEGLVAIEWTVPGEPVVFTIGSGLGASVGFNSAGISFTGNELSPNDERVGIPRGPQFRATLAQRTMDDVLRVALHPRRASSYNQMLADRTGRVVNVDGSATDACLTGPDERGHLVHTNHYVCERMLRYEGDPGYAVRSARRYRRAAELLAAQPEGTVTEEVLRRILSDHEGAPDCLCRHPDRFGGEGKTVFWCVADVTEGRVTYGRGNPCDSREQVYAFAGEPR
ncbi:MAG TPA: C45 family peptidase [Actinomycetota bacterium]|nr:C45 family peptidase [Actinomycetota bacterium]